MGQVGAALVVVEHQLLQLGRQQAQGCHQGAQLGGAVDAAAAPLGKGQGQAVEGQQLGQEGLGGGHPHLDAGADIEDVGHEPAQGAFGAVGDAQQLGGIGGIGHQEAPLLLHQQGRQGVGGFARLGDTDREGVGAQRRRRVAKFAGIKHRSRNARQLFEQVGPHQGRMAAGAASQDLDPLHPLKHGLIEGQGH